MKNKLINTTKNVLLPTWLVLISVLFAYANRFSYLHASSSLNWSHFILTFQKFPIWDFFLDLFTSLFGLILFSLACISIGLIFLRKLKISGKHLAIMTTAFIIGQIIFSFLFLSIISLTRLSPIITITVIGLSVIINMKVLKEFFASFIQDVQVKSLDGNQKRILLISAGLLFLNLFLTSSRLGYDAVSDYFSQAKLMADSQMAISFFPENYMIVSSLHPDILFSIIIQLFGDQSARMLSWASGLAILIFGYLLAEENGVSLNARFYFVILVITSTAFTDLLGDGKVELICTAPIVAAIYWMTHSSKLQHRGIFLLIGILTGFAIISRLYNIFLVSFYTSIFYIIGLIKLILVNKQACKVVRWESALNYIKSILWLFPPLIVLGIYHLWLNWLWLGSPFAPLDFAQKLRATNWEWQFNPEMLGIFRALYPLVITVFNSPQSLGNISPLFVGILPYWFFKSLREKMNFSKGIKHVLAAVLLTLIPWVLFFYTIVEVRYILFIWVVLFLPAGILIDVLINQGSRIVRSTSLLTIYLLLGYIAFRILFISVDTYSPVDNDGQAHCSNISFCTFFSLINEIASPGDRVFSLNAYRYYLRNDLFVCSSRSTEYGNLMKLAQENSPEFWTELYRMGYKYVAYENNFSQFHSRFGTIPSHQITPEWLKVEIISSENENRVYRISTENPPFAPDNFCRIDDTNVWKLTKTE